VEGSKNSGDGQGGNSGAGKSFADLDADTRKACDSFARDLVGEGKTYKTLADWRNKYVEDYFAQ
jgi:hypothetical protein